MKKNYPIKTLREQVNIFIKSKIINGEIKPGEKVNEFELAEELGISRGPIREALRQIEQEGLVTYIPNKGCTVTKLSVKEMYEMSLIRANLEILATEVCEGKFSDETISNLEQCVVKMEEYDKQRIIGKVIEEDQKFHELIVRESGLSHLLKLWHTLDGTNISVYSTLDAAGLLCWGRLGRNHRELLDIIKMRESRAIMDELKHHYVSVPEFVERFLR